MQKSLTVLIVLLWTGLIFSGAVLSLAVKNFDSDTGQIKFTKEKEEKKDI